MSRKHPASSKTETEGEGKDDKNENSTGDYVDELGPIIGLESAKDRTAESVPPVPSPLLIGLYTVIYVYHTTSITVVYK